MAFLRAPDDVEDTVAAQTFHTDREPAAALDAARLYLEGAGTVARPLRGRLEQDDQGLIVHYGRIRTRIIARPDEGGSQVTVRRKGRAPLEETRMWLFGVGIVGFALAWALSWYNSEGSRALSPLVTISLFFLGIVAIVVVLYVVDRSLEYRSARLCWAVEDAVCGDPILVLRREIDGLERSSSIANALLFYAIGLFVQFVVFAVLLGDDSIRENIDEAVTFDAMRGVFGYPVVPAIGFGLIWFFVSNKRHNDRLALVERRASDQ